MKDKDLIGAIFKGLPKENQEDPLLETYDGLSDIEKAEVDDLSKDVLDWLEQQEDLKDE